MYIIIDVILLALIVIFTVVGFRRGFLRSVLTVLRFVVSFAVASALAMPLSIMIYDNFVAKSARTQISDALNGYISSVKEDTGEKLQSFFDDSIILDIISASDRFKADDIKNIEDTVSSDTSDEIARRLETDVLRPSALMIIKMIVTALLFSLVMLLFIPIMRPLCTVIRRLPLIGGLDAVLGGLTGIIFGIFWAVVAAAIMYYCIGLSIGIPGLDAKAVNNTIVCRYILNTLNWQV